MKIELKSVFNYQQAFKLAMLSNAFLLSVGVLLLTRTPGTATAKLEPFRGANGWITRYVAQVLEMEPGDGVLIICKNTPQLRYVLDPPHYSERHRNYYISCPEK